MSKPSWRNLIALGVVKRPDTGYIALLSAIRIVDDFNIRDVGTTKFREGIERLKNYIRQGGKVPALEVSLSQDCQGVDVVEGHRRVTAYRELVAEGLKIEWVRIDPFEGSDFDKHKRIYTSQDNEKLEPLELAKGYKRDITLFSMSHADFAREIGKSRQHVEQMMLLANAPHAVQMMVRSGELAATAAIESVRENGDSASKILQQARQEAQSTGKARITPAALRPWAPSARAVRPLISTIRAVVEAIPEDVRQALATKPADDQTITLPAAVVYELLAQQGAIEALRLKAEKKAAGKPTSSKEAA